MALCVAVFAFLWQGLALYTKCWNPPTPSDPEVAALSERFQSMFLDINSQGRNDDSRPDVIDNDYRIVSRGRLQWDQRTLLWNYFAEKFGSNPSTPYMYSVLPLWGFLPLPSPMWRLRHHEAVVLLTKHPPTVDYFSVTTFCLWSRRRGFVFASLGDSVNSQTVRHDPRNGVFAHVVVTEHSQSTLESIQQALVKSGIDLSAIHVAVVPNALIDQDQWGLFEVVWRLFRFANQTEGDTFLHSHPPVFYLQHKHPKSVSIRKLPKPTYKERHNEDNVHEPTVLGETFHNFQTDFLARLEGYDQTNTLTIDRIPFGPLYIRGLHCVNNFTQCLGDCPDAAYYGSNIRNNTDVIPALQLKRHDELHWIALVDHRYTKAATYSNVALLTSPSGELNKTHLEIRGTPIGVLTNHEYHDKSKSGPFFSWIFTRNKYHCETLSDLVDGCSIISEQDLPLSKFFAYCERLYLNPVTGTGPDWSYIVPAQLYHIQNISEHSTQSIIKNAREEWQKENTALFSKIRLPTSNITLKLYQGEEKLRMLHIIKCGGESLEHYLGSTVIPGTLHKGRMTPPLEVPAIEYGACSSAAKANITWSHPSSVSPPCWMMTTVISSLLCGLNCECCAADLYEEGRFHGTILRSPRSHTLSLFTHGHNAHHTTWARMASDKTLYMAEVILRGAEYMCGHSGTGGTADWNVALINNLEASLSSCPSSGNTNCSGVHVISLRNAQSHAMTCSKADKGSLGQHFRVLTPQGHPVDLLEPDLEEALQSLYRMEWVGITDLFHPSLCLLHFQTNQTLPRACDCRSPEHYTNNPSQKPLGYWNEYRNKPVKMENLSPHILQMIDAHTKVDVELFSEAVRLFLGRLRRVEEVTGVSVLKCIDWIDFRRKTDYIPGLWIGRPDSLLVSEDGSG